MNNLKLMDTSAAFAFFKKLHENQRYKDGGFYWPHIHRVGELLAYALGLFCETDLATAQAISIAGYGHDSIEDTSITAKEISTAFGPIVCELILGMTHLEKTQSVIEYVEQVCTAKEEVRLIKLADLTDNYTRIAHYSTLNDPVFIETKVLSLMEPMYKRITTTRFEQFNKTASHLIVLVHTARTLAHAALRAVR